MTAPRRRGTRRSSGYTFNSTSCALLRRLRGSADIGTRADKSSLRTRPTGQRPQPDPARAIVRQDSRVVFPGSWCPLLIRTPGGRVLFPEQNPEHGERRPDADEQNNPKEYNGLRPPEIQVQPAPPRQRHEQRGVLTVEIQAREPPMRVIGFARERALDAADRPPHAPPLSPTRRCRPPGSDSRCLPRPQHMSCHIMMRRIARSP